MKKLKRTLRDVAEKVKEATEPKVEKKEEKKVSYVRCKDCPLKAGLKDEHTLCPTCEGTGQVESFKE